MTIRSSADSMVYLVGAGPGALGLLTLDAKQAIEHADAILYDGLVNEAILEFAPSECEKICVGKRGNKGVWTQSQIDDLLVAYAKKYRHVVRLKGGDTGVFARTSEEVDRLAAEGIEYRVIPGMTAALAVSAYAGIPLTHRDWSSGVALIAAQLQNQDGESEAEDHLDWRALADFPGTLVMYMSIGSAAKWSQLLIAAGKPASSPVALVRKCSWPDQEVLECDLQNVAQTLQANPEFAPPVISIIGPVVRLRSQAAPLMPDPPELVIVTSPQTQAMRLGQMLKSRGYTPILRPAVTVQAGQIDQIDEAIQRLDRTDWIVFTSRFGVEHFFKRLLELGCDARRFAKVRIAAVGNQTAQVLLEHGLRADALPTGVQSAKGLLADWESRAVDQRVVLVQTAQGNLELKDRLASVAKEVRCVDAYVQVPVESWSDGIQIGQQILAAKRTGTRVWVTATSSNIAKSAWRLLGPQSQSVRWIAISSTVAKLLRDFGAVDVIQSPEASYESLCDTIQGFGNDPTQDSPTQDRSI
ncbi:MAG: uroporphyrinogen-III C-methyltransferase [Planctomycetes bacterium]|nr:uroporphyrinogen-III C-methyltransferase [Planctomycetota bacterium]